MRTLPIVFLCTSALLAQRTETPAYTLANAPLTGSERAQVYRIVNDAAIQYSVVDADSARQREVVMSSPVEFIMLTRTRSKQVLVRGPNSFCGHSGNCPLWIFVRQHGRLRLVLEAGGSGLGIGKKINNGFHDVSTEWNYGAFDGEHRGYRWNGDEYKQVDCYQTKYPRPDEPGGGGNGHGRPVITACR
jgi:hypothetical protein